MNEQELAEEQAKEQPSPDDTEALAPEQSAQAVDTGELTTTPAELEQRLAEVTKAAELERDRFLRAQAEIENMRRRAEKDLQSARKFALERFAKELLAVVDSLDLGLQAAASESPETCALREGMELTLKQLLAVFERFEIRPVDPLGERFNPELHQAMAMEATREVEPNSVVRVLQKGYLLNERLLRPAMVVVSRAEQAAVQPQSDVDKEA